MGHVRFHFKIRVNISSAGVDFVCYILGTCRSEPKANDRLMRVGGY